MVLGGAAVVAAVTGAIIEGTLQSRIAREFPVQGRLVDIGDGRRLQLDCRGAGSPTVILEAGLDDLGSLSWASVHDSLALNTRVCAYSRAGIMWSDPAPRAFDATRSMHDLHAALVAAGEAAPWVMVGHSLGGPYARLFTSAYPNEVRGIVLVDATHPRQMPRLAEALGKAPLPPPALLSVGKLVVPMLARVGVMRLVPDGADPTWPERVRQASAAYYPSSLSALLAELGAIEMTLAKTDSAIALGNRPLTVLTAIDSPDSATAAQTGLTQEQAARKRAAWKTLQEDEATWSSDSRHELVHGTAHHIQLDRPDVVIRAVRDVVMRVRK
jgi:pimeloyl-ACP methyl ester carboxylesterase